MKRTLRRNPSSDHHHHDSQSQSGNIFWIVIILVLLMAFGAFYNRDSQESVPEKDPAHVEENYVEVPGFDFSNPPRTEAEMNALRDAIRKALQSERESEAV